MWKRLVLFYLRQFLGLITPGRIIIFGLKTYRKKIFLIQPDKNIELTFGDVAGRIKAMHLVFRKSGLRSGDVLLFSSKNSADFFKIRAACHLSGVIFFGVPAHIPKETIDYFIRQSGASRVLCLQDTCPDEPPLTKSESWTRPAANHLRCADLATLNVSSGTTQVVPKMVQITNRNWVESLYAYLRNVELKPSKDIVFMCTAPFLTAGSTAFLPSFLAGITHVIVDETTPADQLFKRIKEFKVTRLYMTPSRLIELMEWCKHSYEHIDTLEAIITGTERFPPVKLKAAVEFFGPIISVGYGMVEALPPIAMLAPKDYPRFDTVGKVCDGVAVRITEEGKIAIKSPTVTPGYLMNPDETARTVKGGWFYTSDYGSIDAEGFLRVFGREEELLTAIPKRVFASQLEDAVYELAFIDRCAAIAKDNQVFIFVSFRHQPEAADADEANQILKAVTHTPLKGMDVRVMVKDSLPINPLGKLDRRKLYDEIL